ncbi:hypothetical protein JCM18549_03330 [Halolamina salina]
MLTPGAYLPPIAAFTFADRVAPGTMNVAAVVAALAVGIITGALFTFLRLPIPAPPALPGVVAIVGIYVGYYVMAHLGWGFDLLEALGL